MANGFKNMAFGGANGGAVVPRVSPRKPGRMHWRDYQVGQRPCGPISGVREQALAAAVTEGLRLTGNRQLKT